MTSYWIKESVHRRKTKNHLVILIREPISSIIFILMKYKRRTPMKWYPKCNSAYLMPQTLGQGKMQFLMTQSSSLIININLMLNLLALIYKMGKKTTLNTAKTPKSSFMLVNLQITSTFTANIHLLVTLFAIAQHFSKERVLQQERNIEKCINFQMKWKSVKYMKSQAWKW